MLLQAIGRWPALLIDHVHVDGRANAQGAMALGLVSFARDEGLDQTTITRFDAPGESTPQEIAPYSRRTECVRDPGAVGHVHHFRDDKPGESRQVEKPDGLRAV